MIMLENHSQNTTIGDPNLPYLTKLAHTYGQATSYYGVTHPSQPNYVAAITGQLDITRMNDVATNHYSWTNLVDQLESHGKTWGAYMEALPYAGFTGPIYPDAAALPPSGAALYTNKHDPFVLMDDILSSPARLAKIKPYTSLAADLNSRHAPDFVWISPDQCNDMHGGVYATVPGHPETPCPYNTTVDDQYDTALKQNADEFIHSAVNTIRNSRAWTDNSAIFILSDEADFDGSATDTDLWADVSGCCDSPGYGRAPALPYDFPLVDNPIDCSPPDAPHTCSQPRLWDAGQFGGGLVPAVVVTSHRGTEGDRRRHPVQPLLTAPHDRAGLAPRVPRVRGRWPQRQVDDETPPPLTRGPRPLADEAGPSGPASSFPGAPSIPGRRARSVHRLRSRR